MSVLRNDLRFFCTNVRPLQSAKASQGRELINKVVLGAGIRCAYEIDNG